MFIVLATFFKIFLFIHPSIIFHFILINILVYIISFMCFSPLSFIDILLSARNQLKLPRLPTPVKLQFKSMSDQTHNICRD